ncbi:MAG: hypothetical protein NTW96_01055, partial [Planctomycetia bacterium]|nr:hypothetical protein [Planctomycetia bacterium]
MVDTAHVRVENRLDFGGPWLALKVIRRLRLDRREKEAAMHRRFEERIERELEKIRASCGNRKWKKQVLDRRIGAVMSKNSRAAGLFEVEVGETPDGRATI